MNPLVALLAFVAAAFAYFYQSYQSRLAQAKKLPPGPKPELWGNTVPSKYPWRGFYELSKQYGGLITVWNGFAPSVICSDVKSATELMEKQARDTADRPRSIVGDEVFSHGMRILLVGYNDRWRKLRKALHNQLQPESARQFRPIQEKAAKTVVADILEDPEHFQSHIKTYAATIVVNLGYGRTDKAKYSDPDIQRVIVGGDRLGQLLRPGNYRIDSMPWLRYVPGYLTVPKQWGKEELSLFREQLQRARSKMATGGTQPCFATYITEKQKEFDLSDDEIAYLCGSIFGAGSDTSASAIAICVMAAATHPEQQKMVQEELDRVVGRGRAPTFEDLDDLPLLQAYINESYRCRPVSSGGFQHRNTAPLSYDGYEIPTGTVITGNHWAIHRDAEYYGANVEDFDISRWLTKDGQLNKTMRTFQFGFGRRVCPGQHVANNSVYINAATLMWAFDIRQKKDTSGKEVEIDTLAFTNSVNSHPLPFEVQFTQRVENLHSLLL